ncbi:MAG: histidinol dehydrogenase [Planctomycetota bacterium]
MTTTNTMLKRVSIDDVPSVRRVPIDAQTVAESAVVVETVRARGESAVRAQAERFDEVSAGEALVLDREAMERALGEIDPEARGVLERAADRVARFASAQRMSLGPARLGVPGGSAWHDVVPVQRAGCYAPGGRYPLVSSVLMTACTAKAAGVADITLATPKPSAMMLAAAAISGADRVLAVGGAHAIAALAYGIDGVLEPSDAIVGPGNRWVTAAKQLVSGMVAIDMLAGPSELLVLADETADAATVAADLLAQAEHDVDAGAMLASTSAEVLDAVDVHLAEQLSDLPTADTARAALERNSFGVLVEGEAGLIEVADRLAAEHLQVSCRDAESVARRIRHAGGVFVGEGSAEVFGDYGAGPNHTLPTGGTARSFAGLSVFTFLRVRTGLRIDDAPEADAMIRDTAALARMEQLEAHARAAERRLRG